MINLIVMKKKIYFGVFACLLLNLSLCFAQRTLNESLLHNGQIREYIVYVPAIYDGSTPVPIMFNFHGYRGRASWHMGSTDMQAVADTAGFILVYPQGALFNDITHWNVGAWTRGSRVDDLGFTAKMIDALDGIYNINLDRVYSCGYSNGGYFSFELACKMSDRIAAIGSVGGKMSSETFNACDPQHPTPVITIHGTADDIVSYFGRQPAASKTLSEVHAYWTNFNNTASDPIIENVPNINNLDGSTVEYYTYENGDNCTAVDHYRVNNGGHDWPGVWGNMDIHASRLIWEFVSRYDINGLVSCNATSNEIIDAAAEIKLFPNPASDFITIEMGATEKQHCEIYTLLGEQIMFEQIQPGNNTLNVSILPPNVYLIRIGGKIKKLVIK